MNSPNLIQFDSAHFDSRARQWDDNPVFVERGLKIAQAVRESVPLNRAMRVLDYGCGTGLLAFPLKDEVGAMLLVDTSPGMLAVAAEKIAAYGATHMHTAKLDLVADPAPTEKFDLIVTAMTLHHIPDTDRILRVFHELLAPGGHLCIADLDREDGSFHGIEVDVHHGFERDDLAARAAAAGFADVAFRTVFSIAKARDNATRDYPVFLMTARSAAL
ncbi:MAG: methyltransferase domain-containing protein [Thiobacillus sp.]|nr:methyltransferase domain-containing protein [Thiobacillus sp.]